MDSKMKTSMSRSPVVFEAGENGERAYDIFSRLLMDRIIWLGGPIDDVVGDVVSAQIVYLAKTGSSPIRLIINSPGGHVTSMFAIYDSMNYVNCTIETMCVGEAASAAAMLLLAGTPGHRMILPHSRVMLHQPSGGLGGTVSDIQRGYDNMLSVRDDVEKIVAEHTGKTKQEVKDLLDRDTWFTASQAIEANIVDVIKEKDDS